jgi:hypothetical protein
MHSIASFKTELVAFHMPLRLICTQVAASMICSGSALVYDFS